MVTVSTCTVHSEYSHFSFGLLEQLSTTSTGHVMKFIFLLFFKFLLKHWNVFFTAVKNSFQGSFLHSINAQIKQILNDTHNLTTVQVITMTFLVITYFECMKMTMDFRVFGLSWQFKSQTNYYYCQIQTTTCIDT